MFKTDKDVIEYTLDKLSKERLDIEGYPVYRWFDFIMNKPGDVRIMVIYKTETSDVIKSGITILAGSISVSYIEYVLNVDLEKVKIMFREQLMESEW